MPKKIEDGFDFDGTPIRRVTFDLTDPKCFDDLGDLLDDWFGPDEEDEKDD